MTLDVMFYHASVRRNQAKRHATLDAHQQQAIKDTLAI
jgi:hypothetical protein